MLAVNYSTIRSNLKEYCDKATDENETVIVTRKDEKNVVLISLEKYNEFMRTIRNAEYLNKLDKSIAALLIKISTPPSPDSIEDIIWSTSSSLETSHWIAIHRTP